MEEEEIRNYISGFMSESDEKEFQMRMQQDEALKKQVEHSRRIKNITDGNRKAFSEKVRNVVHTNRKKQNRGFMLVAASVSILLSFFVWYSLLQTSSLDELAASYLEPYPDVVTIRSNESIVLDLSKYRAGNYEASAQSLQTYYNAHQDSLSGLYLGVSYLFIDQPDDAFTILSEIEREGLQFSEDVTWYMALSLIKMNKNEEALRLLRELIDDDTSYAARAAELLNAY